jgi:two-component system, sensor histidine kinase and response regulator
MPMSSSKKSESISEKTEPISFVNREFLAGMTHEIRTPLNSIIGFADMLIDTNLNDEQNRYAMTIKAGGESLLALIDDILDFSKIEAGKMSLENINFDPEVLCHDVCELIRPRIHNKPVTLLCRIGDNVPPKICGDPLRVRQILLNFLGNAVKFTESGEIELSLIIEDAEDGKKKMIIIVRDTGIGISPDRMTHIFEPFQQEKESIARKYGGTGLGLSICKKIASLMDGDITLESEPGKGSSFCFTALVEEAESAGIKERPSKGVAGKKVLISNSGNVDAESIRRVFEAEGMNTVRSDSVSGTFDILLTAFNENQPFDICIVDIGDKKGEGLRLASQVRDNPGLYSSVKLFALSFPTSGCAKRCEAAGFDAFLTIPHKSNLLLQMTKQLLGMPNRQEDSTNFATRRIMTQYSVREDIKKSIRILVAEDNPVNKQLAVVMLQKAGYSVKTADNGREALDVFTSEAEKYDLILMDVQMPEMDGMDAATAIRKWEQSQSSANIHIPIVAVTANAQKEDRMKCLESGMDDYLTKPIKREVVFEMIEKWVL